MKKLNLFAWSQRATVLLTVGFALVLIALVAAYAIDHFKPTTEVRIGSGIYELWLADTDPARVQGLSDVDSLSPNGGLLMVFPSDDKW